MTLSIGQNIVPSINFLMSSIPDNLTELEKIRYIYINLGKLFCYDYRIIVDESVATEPIDYFKNEIGPYKTCYQISEILTVLINGLIPTCKAKVVKRTLQGRRFNKEHVATEVEFNNGLKILLDLTLDLANIQGGLKTKEFGFSTDSSNSYDIISLRECAIMDKKLGFITDNYTDDYIDQFVQKLDSMDYSGKSPKEILEYKILKTKELFVKDFKGAHEATRYILVLFNKILTDEELNALKQYNLLYSNANTFNLMTIYSFSEFGLHFSYSNELGFNKITPEVISTLLKNGWKTNSKSIHSIFVTNDTNSKLSR